MIENIWRPLRYKNKEGRRTKHSLLKLESSQTFEAEREAEASDFKGRKIGTNDYIKKKMGSRIAVCLFLEVNWNTLLKHVLKASDST